MRKIWTGNGMTGNCNPGHNPSWVRLWPMFIVPKLKLQHIMHTYKQLQ